MALPPRARELEVGGGEDPHDPSTSPGRGQGSAVCNRVALAHGAVKTQGADAVGARAGRGGSVRAPPTQGVVAGSAYVEQGAGVVARANKSGRVETPTTQGVVAGSARATEDARAGARATTSGRVGAPTVKDNKSDKVTSAPKAEASSRDTDSAAEDKVLQVFDVFTGEPKVGEVLTPLPIVAELLELEELSYVEFMDSLKAGELAEVVLLRPEGSSLELNSSSVMDPEVLEDERTSKRQTRYGAAILKDPSDPYYALLREFSDVVSDDPPPSVLPPDRGVRHEIDLVQGTKYCTTRQWPLPKEQVDVIDAFFAAKHAAGMVRESKSPHSSPTFCVRKPNGKWRMVHAFNKLNAATIPASTPIPRKDVLQNNMAGCTIFSALDMVDGYYQLLMRESDIPLTAVSTPSGMLWEWLVMPQGLSNAPATFNRLVTQLFRPMQQFVQTYFDDIFVHSRASTGKTAVEAHLGHLREVLLCMRENRLYANINKCIFGAEEIPFLGCFLGKDGVRADPEKNVLADALSRRPDYELPHLAYLESPLYELIREAYADDDDLAGLVEALSAPNKAVELTARQRSRLHRYSVVEGLLYYQVDGSDEPRIVVPNDEDLRHRVLYEAHDTPLSGHLGREKTYTSVARNFWWPHMYKWVRKYVQTCETCQRVKPAPSASAPLMSLPVPTDCWRSVSMDFIFELPADARGHTGILVFVCRLSKMVRLAAVRKSVTAPQAAQLFVDNVFRNH
ncbi:hypothetical protein PR001_g28320, partial [Phytophthora rubi]